MRSGRSRRGERSHAGRGPAAPTCAPSRGRAWHRGGRGRGGVRRARSSPARTTYGHRCRRARPTVGHRPSARPVGHRKSRVNRPDVSQRGVLQVEDRLGLDGVVHLQQVAARSGLDPEVRRLRSPCTSTRFPSSPHTADSESTTASRSSSGMGALSGSEEVALTRAFLQRDEQGCDRDPEIGRSDRALPAAMR